MKSIEIVLRQHTQIAAIAAQIEDRLAGCRRDFDCKEMMDMVTKLRSVLMSHLGMEDRAVYPYILRQGSDEDRLLIKSSARELENMRDGFESYRRKWVSAAAIGAAPGEFAVETRELLGSISLRMTIENGMYGRMLVRA